LTTSTRRLLLALLPLAVLAAACGGGADSKAGAGSAPKLDACQLFTEQDVQAVAGDTLAALSSTMDEAKGRNPLECIYNAGTLDQPRILSLLVRPHGSASAAKDFLASSRSTLSSIAGGKVEDVPGLGDGALWVGGRIQQLHVVAANQELVITVQSPDGTDQLPRARQIATRVLDRLRAAAKPR
jgi:hypothetical protein